MSIRYWNGFVCGRWRRIRRHDSQGRWRWCRRFSGGWIEHPLAYKAATFNDKVCHLLKPVLVPLLIGLVLIILGLVAVMVMVPGK